jgi:hypothetical protein
MYIFYIFDVFMEKYTHETIIAKDLITNHLLTAY